MPSHHRPARTILLALLAPFLGTSLAIAQAQPSEASSITRVVHLGNAATDEEANEVTTSIRNVIDPGTKIVLILVKHDLVLRGTTAQVDEASKLAAELDRPKKSYRLTYTLAEFDNGHRVGVQHFAMDIVVGQHVVLKQGNKVPTITGINTPDSTLPPSFTYIDVGVNFDSTLDQLGNGLRLRSKIDESTATDVVTVRNSSEPVIRQVTLEGTTAIVPGKPVNIGGIDIFGSTRHIDVEVIAEPISGSVASPAKLFARSQS